MTPVQATKKTNGKVVYNNLKDNREIQKPKYKLGQLVRTADIKRVFKKGDSTIWSNNVYTITKINLDTIPSYRINYLPKRYNENFLRSTKLSLEETKFISKIK